MRRFSLDLVSRILELHPTHLVPLSNVLRALVALFLCHLCFGADNYLFTSFRKNGETGVFLALSDDGKKWTPLNDNKPWIAPEHPGMLMRDPFLIKGPDNTWHLLWTWGWNRKDTGGGLKIGHTTSRDLIHWTGQKEIPILPNEPTARNAWAPETVWDAARKEWIIFWSTTIPGRLPGYNHRVYAMTTKDWNTYSPAKVWFDPGFNCIDATLVQDGKRWVMIFKDEREEPVKKNLRLAFAASPAGPWKNVTETFSQAWVEGPSAIKIGQDWWIYFDRYREHHYGAIKTRDWKSFEDVSAQVSFPDDHRHGTVVRISGKEAAALQAIKY